MKEMKELLHKTTLGPILLLGLDGKVIRVCLDETTFDEDKEEAQNRYGAPTSGRSADYLENAAQQIDEYLHGKRTTFDVAYTTLSIRPFSQRVLDELEKIPYGTTRTYSQLAHKMGEKDASRAVGNACASNWLPLIIPCHRIVRGNGSNGEYIGGRHMKNYLIDLEYSTISKEILQRMH